MPRREEPHLTDACISGIRHRSWIAGGPHDHDPLRHRTSRPARPDSPSARVLSTADLLMQGRLVDDAAYVKPTVNLNVAVWRVLDLTT